jgi:hypothetical protein
MLRWSGTDPDQQPLTFDVYFGTTNTPLIVAQNVTTNTFNPGPLQVSTSYWWRIVSRDPLGSTTSGATWSFATSTSSNLPPAAASSPNPPDGALVQTNTPVLSWSASDPENDVLTYHVVIQPSSGPPIIADLATNQFSPGPLSGGVNYLWRVDVSDGPWTTIGPVWAFSIDGPVPVLFAQFDARVLDGGVRVQWELSSDEAMTRYTVFRREKNGSAQSIQEGSVDNTRGSYLDRGAEAGKTYQYDLLVRNADGDEFRSSLATVTMPAAELALYQNMPNPFNPQTTIRYDLPSGAGATRVRLAIMDSAGHRVRVLVNETQDQGSHSVIWNGRDDAGNTVSSGVYFYVLDAGKDRLTRKLVLLK